MASESKNAQEQNKTISCHFKKEITELNAMKAHGNMTEISESLAYLKENFLFSFFLM
jgi:hypothetical protein